VRRPRRPLSVTLRWSDRAASAAYLPQVFAPAVAAARSGACATGASALVMNAPVLDTGPRDVVRGDCRCVDASARRR
jgi:hypothetical protein